MVNIHAAEIGDINDEIILRSDTQSISVPLTACTWLPLLSDTVSPTLSRAAILPTGEFERYRREHRAELLRAGASLGRQLVRLTAAQPPLSMSRPESLTLEFTSVVQRPGADGTRSWRLVAVR